MCVANYVQSNKRPLKLAKLVYSSKIDGLDLKNNNSFKLVHFQPNPFTCISFFIIFLGKEEQI